MLFVEHTRDDPADSLLGKLSRCYADSTDTEYHKFLGERSKS